MSPYVLIVSFSSLSLKHPILLRTRKVSSSLLRAYTGSVWLSMTFLLTSTVPHTEWVTNKHWFNVWNSYLNLCNSLPSVPFGFNFSCFFHPTFCRGRIFLKCKMCSVLFLAYNNLLPIGRNQILNLLHDMIPNSLYGFLPSDFILHPIYSGPRWNNISLKMSTYSFQNAFTLLSLPGRQSSHLLTTATLALQDLWGQLISLRQ